VVIISFWLFSPRLLMIYTTLLEFSLGDFHHLWVP
jgi:hypothetical protein